MAETQPFILQGLCYTFNEFRLDTAAQICGEGVSDVVGGSLLVASTGAADHSITIAAGQAFIEGDDDPFQGMYRVLNDAPVTLQIPAGGGGQPRVDTIVARVSDAEYVGTDSWQLEIVAGTPNAAAALTDAGITASAGAVGDNAIVLAYVLVPAADTLATIISGVNILDARSNYAECGGMPWVSLVAAAATLISATQYTQVALATLAHRDRAYFSVSGSTITVLETGLYDISAMLGFSNIGSTGNHRLASIYRNNTNLPSAAPDGTLLASGRTSHDSGEAADSVRWSFGRLMVSLTAGDTIKLAAFQNTGGTANTEHSADFVAHLTVRKVA